MLSLAILFYSATAVVRRSDFEVTVNDDSTVDTFDTEDSKLEAEAEVFSSTHCGEGETAEFDCVKACMDDKQCRGQAEVLQAIQATGVFKTDEINDGNGYTTGAPCASFYGDNAASAVSGWGMSMSTSMTYCAKGDHDAVECKDGICVAINDDTECKGNSWSDPKKCKIRHKSCGTPTQCAEKCMKDKDCRAKIISMGAAEPVLNSALKVRCVQEDGGEKRCFFTPGNACSGKCQDSYQCMGGKCKAVYEVAAEWKEPEKLHGAFAWVTGGTKSKEHKCKHFWQSCEGEWTTPSDPARDPGCSKCMFDANCCVSA